MKVICNKRKMKWCPLKEKCPEYHPKELLEGEDIEFSCTDNNDKFHECKYVEFID